MSHHTHVPTSSSSTPYRNISLSGVQQLTNTADMEKILQETILREQQIEEELNQHMTEHRQSVERKLERLEVLPAKLRSVSSQVRDLSETISTTCVLAEKVSSQVKALDRSRARLLQTQKRVEDILQVQSCSAGIDSAMKQENWEEACRLFQTYLQIIEAEQSASEEAGQRIQVLDAAVEEKLQKQLETLQNTIRKKVEYCQSQQEVQQYCRYFGSIGLPEEGAKRYVRFVRSQLKDETDALYANLRKSLSGKLPEDQQVTCIDALTALFETVANYAQTQIPTVAEHFGDEYILYLLKELQQQCDIHAPKILDRFREKYSVVAAVQEIQTYRQSSTRHVKSSTAKPPIVDVEEILDGMAALSQRGELFNRFMNTKVEELESPQRGLGESVLHRSMHELLDQYVLMEHYFMEESVSKAIQLSTERREEVSLVDHVFFLLRRSLNRSLYTYNQQAVSVVSNFTSQCLSQQLREELVSYLQNRADVHVEEDQTLSNFIKALNNLQQSTENMKLLRIEAEREATRIFTVKESSKQQVLMRLEEFEETSREFKSLLDKNMEQLASTVRPTLRSLIDKFKSCSYEINEYQFAENEINDPFVGHFVEELDHLFHQYRAQLVEQNFESFVHLCLSFLTAQMEKTIFQKQFTQFGALQLDKDLRLMVSYFASLSTRTIRTEFARLTQMASLLNLESVAEVKEYWGESSGQMTWRLSPNEVHRVLSRRMDFSGEEIATLKL